ncbi:hypothetical protein Lalb_Chr11g0067911 [Lupinus albus]|uniref:Uncharacterized protein n=1 Tax=Lupinus albus TaxID=3870 RepID=A0A6A4PS54_LUPAL|nr:hypothetical protein Lalb_Chr11g0067911 [Lupinus albus]
MCSIYINCFDFLPMRLIAMVDHWLDDAPRPGQPGQAPRPAGVAAPPRA